MTVCCFVNDAISTLRGGRERREGEEGGKEGRERREEERERGECILLKQHTTVVQSHYDN